MLKRIFEKAKEIQVVNGPEVRFHDVKGNERANALAQISRGKKGRQLLSWLLLICAASCAINDVNY